MFPTVYKLAKVVTVSKKGASPYSVSTEPPTTHYRLVDMVPFGTGDAVKDTLRDYFEAEDTSVSVVDVEIMDTISL